MKYAILVLGLLVTPAVAEKYNRDDCKFIEDMLENCTVKPAHPMFGSTRSRGRTMWVVNLRVGLTSANRRTP